MSCSPKKYFGLFGSMYFLGSMFGSLIVPRLSDVYGRKPFVISCSILHVIASVVILMNNDLNTCYFMIFIQGFCMPGRGIIGYVWLTESIRIDQTTKCTSILFTLDSFGIFLASLYF